MQRRRDSEALAPLATSFAAQGDQGIHLGCSACGKIAGEEDTAVRSTAMAANVSRSVALTPKSRLFRHRSGGRWVWLRPFPRTRYCGTRASGADAAPLSRDHGCAP